MILTWKAIPIDLHIPFRQCLALVNESAQASAVLDQLVRFGFQPVEVLPPERLLLASVSFEQLGEQPACLLVGGSLARFI